MCLNAYYVYYYYYNKMTPTCFDPYGIIIREYTHQATEDGQPRPLAVIRSTICNMYVYTLYLLMIRPKHGEV
jgi:hypothetical protein